VADVIDRLVNKEEVELAKAAQRCIVSALDNANAVNIAIVEGGVEKLDNSPLLRLPPKVLRLIADLLGLLAKGKAVSVVPKDLDVTTQEAAMFLNVSRPYLIRLLEEGKIRFHKVGSHRRIHFDDIVHYKEERTRKSNDALQALADQAQEIGMDY
jgi:excisionase family DNA binding protein